MAYPESVREVMDAHDPGFRPADLEEARAAYPRHLETRARIRSESLRWEALRDAERLGAACVDLGRALREVARLWKNLAAGISEGGTLEEIGNGPLEVPLLLGVGQFENHLFLSGERATNWPPFLCVRSFAGIRLVMKSLCIRGLCQPSPFPLRGLA